MNFKNSAQIIFSFLVFFFIQFASLAYADPPISQPSIIQMPIIFDDERIALTKEYRREHYGIDSPSITISPQIITLHWTASNTLNEAFEWFNPSTLHNRPDLKSPSQLNTSAHFLVDRDGTIYQLMPSNWMSRSVIGLNNSTISIENVGSAFHVPPLTEAQVISNIELIAMLKKQYPQIQYLIGHDEYLSLKNTPLWLEKDSLYFTVKNDPGKEFMEAVRKGLASQITHYPF